MKQEGFITINGARSACVIETGPLTSSVDNEPLVKLAKADIFGFLNELEFRQSRTFNDPVGIGFTGSTEGGYGHISGGHLRQDNKRIMNSIMQFKLNEMDRGTLQRGGEITFHCLDGSLGQDDAAMKFVMLLRAGGVETKRISTDELHFQSAFHRGRQIL